jgi:cytochrome c553
MKRSTLAIAAILLAAAPFASATVNIMKDAKAKNPKVTCATCHTAAPYSKTNLNDEGKKWIPAAAKK